jgi:thiamine pyrophosphate-dependent acetolactate synthase large subunit-like protein
MISTSNTASMPIVAALQVLIDSRREADIVVTNQGSARVWPKLSRHPLDFHYNPSSMGGAVPLALGLALAQPGRHVLCVSGDGALLMSLGSLVTVVGSGASNLTIVVLENRMYEVTGGQKLAATNSPLDWAGMARAAGFAVALAFDELSKWQSRAGQVLMESGPRLIALAVEATPQEYFRAATPPIGEQLATFRRALT